MTGRVILFGATGFTGRLAAEAMVRAGLAPVLAGRSADALVELTGDLAGLGPIDAPPTWQLADVSDPASVRALVSDPEDVLVTTVGPFMRLGSPAVEAAVSAGCGYVDSSGEPAFIQEVFEQHSQRASAAGARLLPAFGYDFVPGNLAAAYAIKDAREAGRIPVTIEVGYFVRGRFSPSSGTSASAAGAIATGALALRNGRVVSEAGRVRTFDVDGKRLDALPVGGSELFAVPGLDPAVRDVGVYLGWAGRWTRAAHIAGSALSKGMRLPVLGSAIEAGLGRATQGTTGQGPSATARAGVQTVVVARALDGVGRQVSEVRVEGPNSYDLTAELMAWAAAMLVTGHGDEHGTLGPVDAFGFDALVAGCSDAGLRRVG